MKRRTLVVILVSLSCLLLIVVLGPLNLLLLVKPDLVTIELERRGCYGICPRYTVQILGDGRVRYTGRQFVLAEGDQATRLSPGQVQELVAAFQIINFSALPDQLSYGIEDLEESWTCITLMSTRKCVEIRSTYPAAGFAELTEVRKLNGVIDQVAHVEQWAGTRQEILEQMQRKN